MNNSKLVINQIAIEPSPRSKASGQAPAASTNRRNQLIRLYITAIILLSMMFTLYVWQSTKMIEVKLRIKNIERDIDSIENSNSDLRAEIIKLQSLTRIESEAKNVLGMVPPQKQMYIIIPGNWKNQ